MTRLQPDRDRSGSEPASAGARLLEQYARVVENLLAGAAEPALADAHEAGRRALSEGASALDIAQAHYRALGDALARRAAPGGTPAEDGAALSIANAALRRLDDLREEEARRIAHALHDEAAQLIAAAHLALDELAHDLAIPETPLTAVRARLDDIGEQLRSLSHELRPCLLDDFGLAAAVNRLAEGVQRRSGVQVTIEAPGSVRLTPALETALYRAVQEALNNAVKHGRATSVGVRIVHDAVSLICSVTDNGVGFDIGEALQRPGARGMGLTGIRERVEAAGGKVSVASSSCGTEVRVTVPLRTARAAGTAPSH